MAQPWLTQGAYCALQFLVWSPCPLRGSAHSRHKGNACQNLHPGLGGPFPTVDEVVWLSHLWTIQEPGLPRSLQLAHHPQAFFPLFCQANPGIPQWEAVCLCVLRESLRRTEGEVRQGQGPQAGPSMTHSMSEVHRPKECPFRGSTAWSILHKAAKLS